MGFGKPGWDSGGTGGGGGGLGGVGAGESVDVTDLSDWSFSEPTSTASTLEVDGNGRISIVSKAVGGNVGFNQNTRYTIALSDLFSGFAADENAIVGVRIYDTVDCTDQNLGVGVSFADSGLTLGYGSCFWGGVGSAASRHAGIAYNVGGATQLTNSGIQAVRAWFTNDVTGTALAIRGHASLDTGYARDVAGAAFGSGSAGTAPKLVLHATSRASVTVGQTWKGRVQITVLDTGA